MTRKDWWFGVTVIVAAVMAHALIPRYEWRDVQGMPIVKIDRWTGSATFEGLPNRAASGTTQVEKPLAQATTRRSTASLDDIVEVLPPAERTNTTSVSSRQTSPTRASARSAAAILIGLAMVGGVAMYIVRRMIRNNSSVRRSSPQS